MKKTTALLLVALFAAGTALAQQPTRPQPERVQRPDTTRGIRPPHHRNDADHVQGNGQVRPAHPHHRPQTPQKPAELKYNADGIETTIVKAFPTAKSVVKTNKWTEVYDAKHKLLGYAVYSKPASDGIKGYNGETPVLIALTPKKKISGVYLLPNTETPRFEQRVAEAGFYNHWNGLSINQALKKEVDTVSGATFTSRAVMLSVQAALRQL